MPGLLGKKIGMTSVFSAEGKNLPCTVIEVGPCVVTQIKTWKKMAMKLYSWVSREKRETHNTAVDGPLQKGRCNSQETLGRVQRI